LSEIRQRKVLERVLPASLADHSAGVGRLTHPIPFADLALPVDIARAVRRRGLADAA
jgi:hypothetical protein